MDPDACWARICELTELIPAAPGHEYPAELADELVSAFRDLRDWLARGGYPPVAWAANAADVRRQNISPLAAQHVLGYFEPTHPAAMPAGDFTMRLIEAITRADMQNQRKLALAFPALVSAVHEYQQVMDGAAFLRAKAVQRG